MGEMGEGRWSWQAWDGGCEMWDARCGMRDVGCEMWGARCGVRDVGREMAEDGSWEMEDGARVIEGGFC